MTDNEKCPCDSDKLFADCCGLYLEGGRKPDTAEQLMRSRYTAYVLAREDYLLRTWHATTRPTALDLKDAGPVKWLGLRILRTVAGGVNDREGRVEFVARYAVSGKAERLQEASRFLREDGQWQYVDGQITPL